MSAIGETARLISSLELQDKFSGPSSKIQGSLGGLERGSGVVSKGFGLIGQAAGGVGGALGTLKGRIGQLLTGPLGMLGLGAGLFSVFGVIKGGIDQARDFGLEVGRLATLTGLSTESTSRLAGAFEHFGIATDDVLSIVGLAEKNLGKLTATGDQAAKQSAALTKAQRDLTLAEVKLHEARQRHASGSSQVLSAENNLADAQQALNDLVESGGIIAGGAAAFQKKYGLALTDASGKAKDFNTLLLDTADFFNNKSIPAEQKAAALATIYGKSWQTLVPILSAGRQGIADAEDEAQKLGLTLTKDNLTALGKLKNATRDWGTALGGLKLQLGLAVVPILTDLTKGATNFLTATDKFGRTGSQRVVSFFKDLIEFGKKAFGVIQNQVVPVVEKVIAGWNNLPDPLKGLLVKGVSGNFAIKFLLGFSPVDLAARAAGAIGASLAGTIAGSLAKTVGDKFGDFFGTSAANKLVPQIIEPATGVMPVFVTNPGFGLPGGPGVPGGPGGAPGLPPGGFGVGDIFKLLGFASAAVTGAIIGNQIGHAVGFDPSVKPAVTFEQRQFNDLLKSNDQSLIQKKLDELNANIFSFTMSPLQTMLAGDQLAELKRQRDLLQDLVNQGGSGPTGGTTTPLGGTNSASHHRGSGRGRASLVDPLIDQLVAAHILPNTALGADHVNRTLLPFDEQTRILREINANSRRDQPIQVNVTVNNAISASLMAARTYQIKTMAKIREG